MAIVIDGPTEYPQPHMPSANKKCSKCRRFFVTPGNVCPWCGGALVIAW